MPIQTGCARMYQVAKRGSSMLLDVQSVKLLRYTRRQYTTALLAIESSTVVSPPESLVQED